LWGRKNPGAIGRKKIAKKKINTGPGGRRAGQEQARSAQGREVHSDWGHLSRQTGGTGKGGTRAKLINVEPNISETQKTKRRGKGAKTTP